MPSKLLIIRLSSFGDILQTLSVPKRCKDSLPNSEVHWLVRKDFAQLLDKNPSIDRIHSFDRKNGLFDFIKLCFALRKENFTHIYDAHNNIRSSIFLMTHIDRFLLKGVKVVQRSKNRLKRFLFFTFRINMLPTPFKAQLSFLDPIAKWGVIPNPAAGAQLFPTGSISIQLPKEYIAIAPSAAWPMKRWPIQNWKHLVKLLTDIPIVILGGPEDLFCSEIADVAPSRTLNLAGKISLIESCYVVSRSKLSIAADTGILHAADILAHPNIGLIGPTAFGYPSHSNSKVLEVNLDCKPCSKDGRGKCQNPIYQRCMIDITPESVANLAQVLFNQGK